MNSPLSDPKVLRFGIFEVDLKGGELRKAGVKQKLAGQPFQVLQTLLEHAGEIVTREEPPGSYPSKRFRDPDVIAPTVQAAKNPCDEST